MHHLDPFGGFSWPHEFTVPSMVWTGTWHLTLSSLNGAAGSGIEAKSIEAKSIEAGDMKHGEAATWPMTCCQAKIQPAEPSKPSKPSQTSQAQISDDFGISERTTAKVAWCCLVAWCQEKTKQLRRKQSLRLFAALYSDGHGLRSSSQSFYAYGPPGTPHSDFVRIVSSKLPYHARAAVWLSITSTGDDVSWDVSWRGSTRSAFPHTERLDCFHQICSRGPQPVEYQVSPPAIIITKGSVSYLSSLGFIPFSFWGQSPGQWP